MMDGTLGDQRGEAGCLGGFFGGEFGEAGEEAAHRAEDAAEKVGLVLRFVLGALQSGGEELQLTFDVADAGLYRG